MDNSVLLLLAVCLSSCSITLSQNSYGCYQRYSNLDMTCAQPIKQCKDVTDQGCMDECSKIPECKSAIYQQNGGLCDLYSVAPAPSGVGSAQEAFWQRLRNKRAMRRVKREPGSDLQQHDAPTDMSNNGVQGFQPTAQDSVPAPAPSGQRCYTDAYLISAYGKEYFIYNTEQYGCNRPLPTTIAPVTLTQSTPQPTAPSTGTPYPPTPSTGTPYPPTPSTGTPYPPTPSTGTPSPTTPSPSTTSTRSSTTSPHASTTTSSNGGGGPINCNEPVFIDHQHILAGFATTVAPSATTEEQCINECINAITNFGFQCKSGMFFFEPASCILNIESRKTKPALYTTINNETVDYFEPQCQQVTNSMSAPDETPMVASSNKAEERPLLDLEKPNKWGAWTRCDKRTSIQYRFKNCFSHNPKSCAAKQQRGC